MKTHEIAKALQILANALRRGPDQPIEDFARGARHRPGIKAGSVPAALSALVALADFDKAQWQAFIEEYKFPIDVRPRDASRDILGKLLKFLEENPEARRRLRNPPKERSDISPELVDALRHLLK